MLFVLNIGNTHSEYALYDNGEFTGITRINTSGFDPGIVPPGIPVAISSVVPNLSEKFTGDNVFKLSSKMKTGIDFFGRVDSSNLGADRVADCISLAETGLLPAVCIDCGTAITFDVVDENRVYLGGAILPGRTLLRRALHNYTALLPMVDLTFSPPDKLGTNTVEQMQLGADLGAIGSVREILEMTGKTLNTDNLRAVVTGGDAEFFAAAIPGLESCGFGYTLQGIVKAWELNNES